MWPLKALKSGRSAVTLFEVRYVPAGPRSPTHPGPRGAIIYTRDLKANRFGNRLENDFIVFRGSEHESAGQLLKGYVVLCLSSALKLDELHLRLTGTLRLSYVPLSLRPLLSLPSCFPSADLHAACRRPSQRGSNTVTRHVLTRPRFSQTKVTPSGISQHKVDKTVPILQHRWKPFVGGESKPVVLQPGNYEFPFEYMLPGDTCETLEGIPEASISYRLKARVARGRLASDIHTYKHVRVIRTLEPSALEFLHAMSVENIWPNKVEYSIVVPQKAVVFGGTLPIEMRLTPLLKGLELGDIQARLLEIRECDVGGSGSRNKEYRTEREAGRWKFNATEMNWHDAIEDTGQEGWVIEKKLDLPKRMRQCVQDITQHGVKIRHKVKLTIGLKNPDGHISEVRPNPHIPHSRSTTRQSLTMSDIAPRDAPRLNLHLPQHPPRRRGQPRPANPRREPPRQRGGSRRATRLRRARPRPALRRRRLRRLPDPRDAVGHRESVLSAVGSSVFRGPLAPDSAGRVDARGHDGACEPAAADDGRKVSAELGRLAGVVAGALAPPLATGQQRRGHVAVRGGAHRRAGPDQGAQLRDGGAHAREAALDVRRRYGAAHVRGHRVRGGFGGRSAVGVGDEVCRAVEGAVF